MKKLSKFKKNIIIVSLLTLFIVICGYFIYNFFFVNKFNVTNYEKDIVINYGEEFKPKQYVCYGNRYTCNEIEPTIDGNVNTNELGEYDVKYFYNYNGKDIILDQKVKVSDLEAPVIKVLNDDEIIACSNGNSSNLKLDIKDNLDEEITNIETVIENDKLVIYATDSSNNKGRLEVRATIKDVEAPVITINGKKNLTHIIGIDYKDEGATVTDNCDTSIDVITEGTVNKDKEGTYKITYKATDSAGNTSTETRTVTVKQKTPGTRVIYLTFDDGPGAYTSQLLDVLKKYNVKATFFVTGKGDDSLIKREYEEGHTVGLHTYSHDYATVYSSVDDYFNDLNKIQNRVERITGEKSYIIRFPGGSSNTTSKKYDGGIKIMSYLTKEVTRRGYKYFDWNISSGDAGGTTTSDGVYNNVISNLKSGSSVVLQHDIKKYSVEAVERIIQYGLANGYTFERLTMDSPGAHHGVNN